MTVTAIERKILAATQSGLPFVREPYKEVAGWLGMEEAEVISALTDMQERGVIRRIAIAPNHYALGLVVNAMSVWDVDDGMAEELGEHVGACDFVSHCYLRPRALPVWPYNLFAMIHGFDQQSVGQRLVEIEALLGSACRSHDVLNSVCILKKTGMRLAKGD